MRPLGKAFLTLLLAAGAGEGACQSFHYVEPGTAACPAAPAQTAAVPKVVRRGVAVQGAIRVACGFEQGSYTLSVNSTDPAATIVPKTFLVNFGRVVGSGAYAITFSTPGAQSVSISITSNMGSPAVQGRFVSAASAFQVVDH